MEKQHRTNTNTHVTYSKICEVTGKKYEVTITLGQENKWQNGAYLQNICSELDSNQREFLISGMTPWEWDKIFGDEPIDEPIKKEKKEDNAIAITFITTNESPSLLNILKELQRFKCRLIVVSKAKPKSTMDIQEYINKIQAN